MFELRLETTRLQRLLIMNNPTHIGIKDSVAISVIKPEHNCKQATIHYIILGTILYQRSVLWRCWLGGRKGIQPVKLDGEAWLSDHMQMIYANDLHMVQMIPLPPHHLLLH